MDVISVTKHAKMSPKKGRDLAREIQGKKVPEALNIVSFSRRKAGILLTKTLKSAIANAEHNFELDADELTVKLAVLEDGRMMRRGRYGARGQFKPIVKRSCHVRIVLTDGVDEKVEDEDEE